jgi:multimeric flavodoxin WrbA
MRRDFPIDSQEYPFYGGSKPAFPEVLGVIGAIMKVLVLNGSPKGDECSVSMKHMHYLQKRVDNDYAVVPVAKDIRKIENDEPYFHGIIEKIRDADIIVWVFPVYLYMVPSQLKRFVEIVFDRKKEGVFAGKYSTSLSTSAMIYDYPAHEYIHAISEDLRMTYMPGFSFEAVMEKSLLDGKIRESFIAHFKRMVLSAENKAAYPVKYAEIPKEGHAYSRKTREYATKKDDKRITVISDHAPGSNLERMVDAFISSSRYAVEVVNLNDIVFSGGCAGCLQCQFEGACIFPDDVRGIFQDKIIGSAGVVFAATIVDRHVSSRFKAFLDRSIFMAQTPTLRGKFAGFLVSGPLRRMELVGQFIEIYISNRFMIQVGTVSDEYQDSYQLTRIIAAFAENMANHIEDGISMTSSFFSRTYHLMLREMLSIISSAKRNAYNYHRKHKLFDYPHKNAKHVFQKNLYNVLFNFPILKYKVRKNIVKLQLSPYDKLLEGE